MSLRSVTEIPFCSAPEKSHPPEGTPTSSYFHPNWPNETRLLKHAIKFIKYTKSQRKKLFSSHFKMMTTILFAILFFCHVHIQAWQIETIVTWSRPSQNVPRSMGDNLVVNKSSPLPQARTIKLQETKRTRKTSEVSLLRRQYETEKGASRIPKFNVQIDPWGVDKQQSHLSLPSWAFTDAAEQRHLAAMKVVLGRDLEKLDEKTITRLDGETVKVTEAFPDVYGDFRLLRFLRKDKVQDPVTAAVRYRQFLQWRDDNHVDEIRLHVEERLGQGGPDAFLPQEDIQIVSKYLPCTIKPLKSCKGLIPVVLQVGEWDTQGLTNLIQRKELSIRAFLGYWIHIYEALNLHLYQESLRTKRVVSVEELFDLNGLSPAQFSRGFVSHVLKPWIEMTQSNYPETTNSIIFLRPPKIFSLVWRLLSPLFSKKTLAKVSIDTNFDTRNLDFCPAEVEEQQVHPFHKTTISGGYGVSLV